MVRATSKESIPGSGGVVLRVHFSISIPTPRVKESEGSNGGSTACGTGVSLSNFAGPVPDSEMESCSIRELLGLKELIAIQIAEWILL